LDRIVKEDEAAAKADDKTTDTPVAESGDN
jgi:hypothetical protein